MNVHPEIGINNLSDWKAKWKTPNSHIRDEHGDPIGVVQMLEVITNREWNGRESDQSWYAQNNAEPGPNRLARHIIDGQHCVGHGDGTYDLIAGEFS